MTILNPLLLTDAYKVHHREQYNPNTSLMFINLTARGSKIPGVDHVVFFGLQYFLKEYLQNRWQQHFFGRPAEEVCKAYARRAKNMNIPVDVTHIQDLHALGHLPVEIWALPEGTRVPVGVPMLVMWNTDPRFYWLPTYLETQMLGTLWGPCTTATVADLYRSLLDDSGRRSGLEADYAAIQGHDFSARGMFCMEASGVSGMAHLTAFRSTDTVFAIDLLEQYYGTNADEEMVAISVPATEHSVMSSHGQVHERETFRRLITETHPEGIVSIVSDTWNYWNVWTNILPSLKDEILNREGTVTIRPDSGDPVKIVLGDPNAPAGSPENKGSYELAWELFGGTRTQTGHRLLDRHINVIYGDTITPERCREILHGLLQKGFAPNIVFGIGASTYQKKNRDTFMFAMKATYAEVNGKPRELFKDPQTDTNHDKRSARGLLAVRRDSAGELVLHQQVANLNEVKQGEFQLAFRNGHLENGTTLAAIRERLDSTRADAHSL